MRDEEERALVVQELLLEKLQGLDIKVICRLVHHEQIRWLQEEFREHETRAFSAGKRLHRRAHAFGREEKVGKVRVDVFLHAADDHLVAVLRDVLADG